MKYLDFKLYYLVNTILHKGRSKMKKSKYLFLLFGITLLIIVTAIVILVNNSANDDKHKTNVASTDVSQEDDAEKSKETDESAIETMEEDDYTILLKGSARPKNGEIDAEEAARLGVEELEKEYTINQKDYSVEMIFLDGITKKTGTWSGHIVFSDKEKYEFLIDGKNGKIEYLKKYD